MLLAYTADGAIVATSGTNSAYPNGPDNATGWLTAIGQSLGAVQVLRLHDSHEAELVDLVLQGRAKVRNGRIVEFDPPPVTPPSTDPSTPDVDVVAQIAALQAWAKDIQSQVDAATEILMGGLA